MNTAGLSKVNPDDFIPPGAWIPAQHGGVDGPLYLRSLSGQTEIQSARITQGYVDGNSNAYGWAGIDRLDVLAGTTHGEHVGRYIKAYRHPGATASMWGACIEGTDWSGVGTFWGAEIDAMSVGHDPAHLRLALGLVFGETQQIGLPLTYERVYFDYGICGMPFRRVDGEGNIVPDNVFTKVWMTTQAPCEVFTQAPSGTWRTWDDGNNIGDVFDGRTGYKLTGMRTKIGEPYDFTKAAFAVQVDNGAIYSFGREIIGPNVPTTMTASAMPYLLLFVSLLSAMGAGYLMSRVTSDYGLLDYLHIAVFVAVSVASWWAGRRL